MWTLILSNYEHSEAPGALQRWSGGEYLDGKKHGEWVSWEEKGRKRVGRFLDDKKHGQLVHSDWDGSVFKVEEYENDSLIKTTQYKDGKPVPQ